MYFPGADWDPQSVEQDLINYFYQHYSSPDPFPPVSAFLRMSSRVHYLSQDFLARAVRKSGAIPLTVNFPELRDAAGPQFVAGLRDNAETVIAANGAAAYQVHRSLHLLMSLLKCRGSWSSCHRAGRRRHAH